MEKIPQNESAQSIAREMLIEGSDIQMDLARNEFEHSTVFCEKLHDYDLFTILKHCSINDCGFYIGGKSKGLIEVVIFKN